MQRAEHPILEGRAWDDVVPVAHKVERREVGPKVRHRVERRDLRVGRMLDRFFDGDEEVRCICVAWRITDVAPPT